MALSVEHWFEGEIRPRYADPSDEKAFLISDIQEWINTLNIQETRWPAGGLPPRAAHLIETGFGEHPMEGTANSAG